jgi:DNA-binding transcriptional ArsR family regulator
MDEVFKALADDGRRALLDALRRNDAQTLGELCDVLPEMTRFGVMKHLRVLEDAHLVVTEKVGRTKLHHLNPVPIREIHDRWISNYAAPYIAGLIALRDVSEAAPHIPSEGA